jgi:CDP-glucose 4,6-dehydratase
MNTNFWKNRKVLITGHTGFKGSWLSLWLQHLGAEVVGVSLDPPTVPSLFKQAKIESGMVSLYEDIRNGEAVKKIFKKHRPEIVFHLAAQSLVRYSYRNPVETYETNVMGTLHVLEGIRSIETVRSAVMITTDKCYENKEWEWGYRENEPMGGHDPYSSSKGSAELLISSYRNSYYPINQYDQHKTAIASARAGNVIGGGDWAEDRLIPDIIRAFQNGDQVEIRSPNAVRPWQHVLEPLAGYIKLAELMTVNGPKYAEAWNFGPREEDARPVQWIVERMTEQWGGDASWRLNEGDHPYEANYLKLDCSKAYLKLNWSPKWDLNYSLEKINEWYKPKQIQENFRQATLKQIVEYMNTD